MSGMQPPGGGMPVGGAPIFMDPSAQVVYQTVPPSAAGTPVSGDRVVGGQQGQPAQAPSVAMMVVQNPQQQQHPPLNAMSGIPLPPGMEVVLGDKKYTIQYQSYEMTREKASEYIAKCTGTPFSRMSSPPNPEAMHPYLGSNRIVEGRGGMGASQRPTATAIPTVPTGVPGGMASAGVDRGMISSLQRGISTDSGPRGARQPLSSTATSYAPPPPPPPQGEGSQNLGYFWEDGVWKVWQADGNNSSSNNEARGGNETSAAAAKMPPPLPVQPQQTSSPQRASPPSYAAAAPQQQQQQQQQPPPYSQAQQHPNSYPYQYQYPPQQHQPPPPHSVIAATEHSSYALPPHQQHLPPLRGQPPQPLNLHSAQVSAGSSSAPPAPPAMDPMSGNRYMI